LNPHERTSRSRLKKDSSLIRSFERSRVQVFKCRWRYKSYRGLHDDFQRRKDCKLVQDDIKYYYWWCLSNNREGGYYKALLHASWHMSERGFQVLYKMGALPGIKYCKLDLCKFRIMGRQRRIPFSSSQHKTKGLLNLIHTDV